MKGKHVKPGIRRDDSRYANRGPQAMTEIVFQEAVLTRLNWIIDALNMLNTKENIQMATLDEILSEAERNNSLDQSVLALVTRLQQEVRNAGGNQAKIDEIFNNLKSNNDRVTEALAAGTPAEGNTGSGSGGSSGGSTGGIGGSTGNI